MTGLKRVVKRLEEQTIKQAEEAYIKSLSSEFLGEYYVLTLIEWLCSQPEPPLLSDMTPDEWSGFAYIGAKDAEIAALHAKGFTSEQRARMAAMEQEYLEGGLKRGLPKEGRWAEL